MKTEFTKIYNEWYKFYSTIPIDDTLKGKILEVAGVNAMGAKSRYTMNIEIGKLFNVDDVFEEIKKILEQ